MYIGTLIEELPDTVFDTSVWLGVLNKLALDVSHPWHLYSSISAVIIWNGIAVRTIAPPADLLSFFIKPILKVFEPSELTSISRYFTVSEVPEEPITGMGEELPFFPVNIAVTSTRSSGGFFNFFGHKRVSAIRRP